MIRIGAGLAAVSGVLAATPAAAQHITVKPLIDARLRYESVDQDRLPRDADAVTLRARTGVQATRGRWAALVESEETLDIVGRYFDGVHGDARRPLVADPRDLELNRAQLSYTAPAASITAGRQRVELLDQRFVGSSDFRQNQQTYDAVRLQWHGVPHLSADLTYAWRDHTVNGERGRGARPPSIRGDNLFAIGTWTTPAGALSGFAYLVDQDARQVQGFRLSSQTYGLRFAGARPIGTAKLAYTASWARQSDWHRNPNHYAADYWLGEAALSRKAVTGTVGYEVLGADKGVALTSVQTPLASLFKFQGWADRFTTTPPDGVRDLYATAGATWKRGGAVSAITLTATGHHFASDRLVRHYGDELDLLASAKFHHTTLSVRYADYQADRFATDTRKLWLSAEWTL